MALTIATNYVGDTVNGVRIASYTVTFDASYVGAAGEVFDISADFQGSPDVVANGDDGYHIRHNRGTAAAGTLIAEYADYDAVADGALIGVPATTDLSAVICKVIAVGDPAIS